METLGILLMLEAKPGKEKEAEQFLASALPLAEAEPDTLSWYALKLSESRFAIFDTFANQKGREAHLSGAIAKALFTRAPELFDKAPQVHRPEILAVKRARG